MIKLGNNSIGKIYLGSNSIGKAYLGSNLVFQKGSSPTPPGPVIEPVFYDRLVFDGTAYIDTNIIPDANASFRVNLGYETTKANQRIFFLSAGTSSFTGAMLNTNTNATNRVFSIFYGSSSNVSNTRTLAWGTESFNFWITPKQFGWGYYAYTITKGEDSPSGGVVIGNNTSHTGPAYTGRMGYFRIYGSDAQNATSASDLLDNYTPVYTLRPCTYNGEAGFWCVETSTFYGNTAGSGTLSVLNL